MKLDYGKYKGIIVSIALFLLLDASVLMMNFYISFEISEDAVGVNTAGRQRMLSQRMMKSLLDMQSAKDITSRDAAQQELGNTVTLFDSTLLAFMGGGETKGAGGDQIYVEAVSSPASLAAVNKAQEIWQPFSHQLNKLLKLDSEETPGRFKSQLARTVTYGREHNVTLLKLMNQLTLDLEAVASSKATRLRYIQTVGISLAVINFFIIMFHFLRQLRDSDEKIEAARQETQEILDTVNEGLMLVDRDMHIGEQSSQELGRILGRTDIAGTGFADLLKGIVSEKDLSTAQSFIRLLFDPRKKQKLIGNLNPLRQVQVHIPGDDGTYTSKYLSFSFSRVIKGGEIIHVLVTVMDISRQVQLAQELENARVQGQEQLEMLSTILQANGDMLSTFLKNSFTAFDKINELLKNQARTQSQYIDKANQIYAVIHNYKGEAASLELTQFSDMAHEIEDELIEIKSKKSISGNDFLRLAIQLNRLIAQTESIQKLVDKVAGLVPTAVLESPADIRYQMEHLQVLADSIAERQGKSVEVICSGFNDYRLNHEVKKRLNTIVIQMIRNSVSHGIENCGARLQSQKNETGEIQIRLIKRKNGRLQLTVEDDGAGIDMTAIRQAAIERGVISF